VLLTAAIAAAFLVGGCARIGRLAPVQMTIAPTQSHVAGEAAEAPAPGQEAFHSLFGDSLIGLTPGTADSSRRYLGRLRGGYTSDTLNLMVYGDNRPAYRSSRLAPEYTTIAQMFSPHPVRILKGLITIPWMLVKGLYPDLALIRDIPARVRNMPTWGREREVLSAMLAKIDSLNAHGRQVTAVINTGDLVKDGRFPAHWERFLQLTRRAFPTSRWPETTSAPTPSKAPRTGGPRPDCRSAGTAFTTASIPPTDGCDSSHWIPIPSSIPGTTGLARFRSSTRRRSSPGWWHGSRSIPGRWWS
jgi:hypothetical protein